MPSSTLSEAPSRSGLAAAAAAATVVRPATRWWRAPGDTPLVRDAAAPAVLLKLEALEPSGHLSDRFVDERLAHHLAGRPATTTELLVARLDRFAISLGQASIPAGLALTALHSPDDPDELRLRALAARLGLRLRRADADADARQAAAEAWLAERPNAVLVEPLGPAPHSARALADELRNQLDGATPDAVVLPHDAAPLLDGLSAALGARVRVELVAAAEPDAPPLRALQRELGRQGILVGPDGAAVAARARELAADGAHRVVALLPDGGHRHLGWWDGWGARCEDDTGGDTASNPAPETGVTAGALRGP